CSRWEVMALRPNCGTQGVGQAEVCFICGTALERPAQSATDRKCPACGNRYPASYTDDFCTCGVELARKAAAPPAVERPAAGTQCLVLYGPDRRPARYFPLT